MIYYTNIEKNTLDNKNFRKVVYTGNMQLVLMSLKPNEEIGMEKHDNVEQFFKIERGNGVAIIKQKNGEHKINLSDGSIIIIPKSTYHNIINTGKSELKLYTIYVPPNHPNHTVHITKPAEEHDDGYQEDDEADKNDDENIDISKYNDPMDDFYRKYIKYKLKYIREKQRLAELDSVSNFTDTSAEPRLKFST